MSQQWKNSADGGDEDDVQVPLGAGDMAPTEEYAAPRGPRINSSTLTLVAAFATAIAVLYLLGLQNKPRAASAQEAQHQQEIDRRIELMLKDKGDQEKVGKLFKGTRHLVEILTKYFESSNRVADLPGNPFEHEAAPVADVPKGETPPEIVQTPTTSEGLFHATQVFQGLRLQMVISGNHPAALVSDSGADQMVQVGAHIKMWEVIGIDGGSVQLRFKDADGKVTDVALKQNSVPLTNKH